ncbi:MAG TPA: Rieske (2Fe-2S) protein [Candidatus Acidoferrales bacterium]|nr:Rieske (2Fe-2S) protein [Candidatus Acidoferrales bacterium]
MSDESERAERIDKLVAELLAGRRLRLDRRDVEDQGAVQIAARLAAARTGRPAMTPEFRRRLATQLTPVRAPRMTRRKVLTVGAAAIVGGAAGLLVGSLPGSDSPVAERLAPGSLIQPDAGVWVDVGALADLAEGQPVAVNAGAVGAYIFRRGSQVRAVSSICSHLPCQLQWRAAQGVLLCPCHQQSFTPEGKSTSASYPLPNLSRVMVKVQRGRVMIFGT